MIDQDSEKYPERLSGIKIIVSEIDGIITEGLSGIGELNVVMFKNFFMRDFEAINLLKKDFIFVFLSSDPSINMSLCRKKNIPFYYAERNNKVEIMRQILNRYSLTPDNLSYVGCSYSDIDCIYLSKFSFCPEDSAPKIKSICDCVVPVYGGGGVLCSVYEFLKCNLLTDFMEI